MAMRGWVRGAIYFGFSILCGGGGGGQTEVGGEVRLRKWALEGVAEGGEGERCERGRMV
jgi:hypothetical protein